MYAPGIERRRCDVLAQARENLQRLRQRVPMVIYLVVNPGIASSLGCQSLQVCGRNTARQDDRLR